MKVACAELNNINAKHLQEFLSVEIVQEALDLELLSCGSKDSTISVNEVSIAQGLPANEPDNVYRTCMMPYAEAHVFA